MAALRVVNCPGNELALTNAVFCSEQDAATLVPYCELGEGVFFVKPHPAVQPGTIALNGVQRSFLRVDNEAPITAHPFAPPPQFDAVLVTVAIRHVRKNQNTKVDAASLAAHILMHYTSQVACVGQKFAVNFQDLNYIVTPVAILLDGQAPDVTAMRGMLVSKTQFVFEPEDSAAIKVTNQKGGPAAVPEIFKSKEVTFETLGIGGLDRQFTDIFRRAFSSRMYPPAVVERLGIKHVRGMLLFGPPGTGKTLIARQIGKMLNGNEPKVVNGPELLNKYVGQSEENIRALFADAEADQAANGNDASLHIIIFDEIDAICKQRGKTGDSTGVNDSMVNQLLTKIDGVDALNNILLICMTNRKDLLDDALLRPGRLEVQVEIGLPDETGRQQILKIHTSTMEGNNYLGSDVDVVALSKMTANFSGAEIEGLVKSATSFALARQIDLGDLGASLDDAAIKVTMEDFNAALGEVKSAFGASVDTLERCRLNGIIPYGEKLTHLQTTCRALVEQVRVSERTPLLTCLMEGVSGVGKTALAASIALESGFPFIKFVSSETMVGMHEGQKTAVLAKVFDDAYKSPLSILVLDDIERLLEYVDIGPRFSNVILQALLVLLKRLPPEGHKLLVIGTSSNAGVMQQLGVADAFNVVVNVPTLGPVESKAVLEGVGAFSPHELDAAVAMLDDAMPIKRLLMLLEVARHSGGGEGDGGAAADAPIPLARFMDCMQDLGSV